MSQPIIGLTTSRTVNSAGTDTLTTNEAYIKAVLQAGGLPVMIPTGLSVEQAGELFSHLNGVLFTGGGDVDPVYYGGKANGHIYGIDRQS